MRLYGTNYTSVNASSNGNLQVVSDASDYSNLCLPAPQLTDAILPHWDDLRTDQSGGGIFTSVSGSAPNRIFNIEWRAVYFSGSGAANFEARLYEGQDRFDFIYGQLAESGNGATVGVQRDTGNTNFTQFECNTGGLTPGLQLTFTQPPCNTTPTSTSTPGGPTFTNTPTATSTRTFTRTNTPTITLTPTITPTATATTCVSNIYNITQSTGATIVAGTVDTGNHCDDCATSVNLPFAYQLYNQVFTTASVTSNGQWDFQTADSAFSNTCLPDTAASYAIFPTGMIFAPIRAQAVPRTQVVVACSPQ